MTCSPTAIEALIRWLSETRERNHETVADALRKICTSFQGQTQEKHFQALKISIFKLFQQLTADITL